MVSNIINRFNIALRKFDHFVELIFKGGHPPQLCAIEFNQLDKNCESSASSKAFSLKDMLENGFLWAVPKHRRTIEKRMIRRYGHPKYVWKLLVPKNLITCVNCGYVHEIGILCVHCYGKIKKETAEMQKVIMEELKLDPVDKEVVVLYQDDDKSREFWKNQRIVEMPKKRPEWFHKNLLQPTMQEPSDSKEVKPTNIV